MQGPQWQGLGAFFTDANMTSLYRFAGFSGRDTEFTNTVDILNITSHSWVNSSVSGGSFQNFDTSWSASATTATSGLGLAFITGGLNGLPNSEDMISFDASDTKILKRTDETISAPIGLGATMQYARIGTKGVLIAVGGIQDVRDFTHDYMSVTLIR